MSFIFSVPAESAVYSKSCYAVQPRPQKNTHPNQIKAHHRLSLNYEIK